MTMNTQLEWTHLRPLQDEFERLHVIHLPAFPWLNGYACYYPTQDGQVVQMMLAHRLNEQYDIIVQRINEPKKSAAISAESFSLQWASGKIDDAFLQLKTDELAMIERKLESTIGSSLLEQVSRFIHQQARDKNKTMTEQYEELLAQLEQTLPICLHGRYHFHFESSIESAYADHYLLYLFGGLTYHLHEDLHELGYVLSSIDFENGSIQLKLTDEREKLTIQWAKDYTNAILLEQQNSGYTKALIYTERFHHFCHKYPYIYETPSLGGQLGYLSETLKASCKMGIVKEGIIKRNWDSKRIVAEWKQIIETLPLSMHDSILVGSPMETLFSFSVNTVAWVEMKHDYAEANEIIHSYLSYYEKRLQQANEKEKELSHSLAVAFYRYCKKMKRIHEDDFPAIARFSRFKRVPFRQLAKVHKPKQKLTKEIKGFYHYVSREHSHRVMGSSVLLSVSLMCIILLIN